MADDPTTTAAPYGEVRLVGGTLPAGHRWTYREWVERVSDEGPNGYHNNYGGDWVCGDCGATVVETIFRNWKFTDRAAGLVKVTKEPCHAD